MIEGPVGDMLERNHAMQDFTPPPYLAHIRPMIRQSEGAIAVLICSDPRLDPLKILAIDGINGAPVTIVRNPGGRAAEGMKALVGMQAVLNCGTILVIHHTDCGMTHITDQDVRDHLIAIAPGEKEVIYKTKFGEIRGSLEDSIKEDLDILRASTWIKKTTRLIGLKYDTHTGVLYEVEDLKPQIYNI